MNDRRQSVNGHKLARSMSTEYDFFLWTQNKYLSNFCQYQLCSTVHESSAHELSGFTIVFGHSED